MQSLLAEDENDKQTGAETDEKTEQCYTNRELSWFYQDAFDRCVKEV